MKWLHHRCIVVVPVVALFIAGILLYYARLGFLGSDWATYPANKHIYNNGIIEKAGDITDKNKTVLATTKDKNRIYNSNSDIRKATVHAVGDLKGYVSTGMQSAYLSSLCGYDAVNGIYNVSGKGNNIELTIDSDLCVSAMKALGSYSGTVGVCNYKTGEIVCMVSTPTFDPASSNEPSGEGVYVNRFLSGVYAPGSVFKLVTTLAALENLDDCNTMTFDCNYGVTIMDERLTCMGRHGNTNLDNALVYSCNAFFAQTALKLGRNTMTKTAEKVGFNKTLKMDGIECAASKYSVADANDIDFGWSGIGQQNDLVNPYQYISFVGAIANEGVCVSPHIIKKITSPKGIQLRGEEKKKSRMLSKENARRIGEMMRKDVSKNYGDYRFPGLNVCGKTGTAEIGKGATPHSWFVGFIEDTAKPYAFVVTVENAGSGNGVALQIASRVLKNL